MPANTAFHYGLIEGFYGRQWRWDERRDMAAFLAAHGYGSYIYAPKGDTALRGRWRAPFTDGWLRNVNAWAAACRAAGMRWGLGFSPLGLQSGYGAGDREHLLAKLREIDALGPDVLWILFDDMRGDSPALAGHQCRVLEDVLAVSRASCIAMCPTYYSFDPLLDQVFGQRPPAYLEELGRGMPAQVDILWTGESVLSAAFTESDCRRVADLIRRPPLIWDNYPVNDGRKTCHFLHLDAFRGRPWRLREWTAGHMVNPMNQAWLSRLPLATLEDLYREGDAYDADAARQRSFSQLPSVLRTLIGRDWALFHNAGLAGIDEGQQKQLLAEYGRVEHPAAAEVRGWLQHEYQFDPACLND